MRARLYHRPFLLDSSLRVDSSSLTLTRNTEEERPSWKEDGQTGILLSSSLLLASLLYSRCFFHSFQLFLFCLARLHDFIRCEKRKKFSLGALLAVPRWKQECVRVCVMLTGLHASHPADSIKKGNIEHAAQSH